VRGSARGAVERRDFYSLRDWRIFRNIDQRLRGLEHRHQVARIDARLFQYERDRCPVTEHRPGAG
jgi:hypothetical protein